MVSRSFSFIDIAVLDRIRQRFCAGEALLVLSTSLDEIIWANGPGARLLGFPDFESTVGGDPGLPFASRRQIQATRNYPRIGADRQVAVRLPAGHSSQLVAFAASEVTLPDGETALLLAAAEAGAEARLPGEIAERAISGLSGEGRLVALVGEDGEVVAASQGFDEIGLSREMLATLVGQTADQADRLVKRMVETDQGAVAAGIARLSDDPLRHLLMIVADMGDEVAEPEVQDDVATESDVTHLPEPPADDDVIAEGTAPAGDRPAAADDHWYFNGHAPTDEDSGTTEPEAGPEAETEPRSASDMPTHAQPIREIASGPVRFVWRTDAEGRFSMIGDEFRAAVGDAAADVIGRSFRDVAAVFDLDPNGEIAGLLERRDTWSGRTVLWPIAGTDLNVPLDLAALPVYGRERNFEGFRGFGVARMGDAATDPDAIGLAMVAAPEPEAPAEEAVAEPTAADDPFRGEVPALDIGQGPERRYSDKVIRLAERRPAPPEKALSSAERLNFREIGQKLRDSGITAPRGDEPAPPLAEALDSEPGDAGRDVTVEAAAEPISQDLNGSEQPELEHLGMGEEALAAVENERGVDENPPMATQAVTPLGQTETAGTEQLAFDDPSADIEDADMAREPEETPVALDVADEEFVAEDLSDMPEPVGIGEAAVEAADDGSWPDYTGAETDPSEAPPVVAEAPVAEPDVLAERTSDDEPDADPVSAAAEVASYQRMAARIDEAFLSEDGAEPSAEDIAEPLAAVEPAMDAWGEYEADDPDPSVEIGHEIAQGAEGADGDDPVETVSELNDSDDVAPEDQEGLTAPETSSDTADGTPAMPAVMPARRVDAFLPSAFAGFGQDARLPGIDTTLMSRLPLPLLVHSGDQLHYANRELLQFTGYGTLSDLAEAGGLDAMFVEPYGDPEAADRKLRVRTRDGAEHPVDAFLQSVAWNGGKALLLALKPLPVEMPAVAPLVVDGQVDESEIEARSAELRAIIDTATDGVVIIDNDGTVRSISRPAEALFGFDSNQVAGRPFETLFAMESQRAAREYLNGLADNGVATVLNDGREVIGREAQGRFIPLFMTIGRLPKQSGYCAVMRDITQWKRAEEEATQARSQAERASSQKSDFLARVSHEIRTPLNAIIGFSELMMDEKFGPISNERYRDYLRDINKSGNHVLDLVNDLLDISKIEAGEQELSYEAVSLNDTLGETVAMMQPQANRDRVIIRSSFASRLPDVVADLRSVRQIGLNLLSNAIRYTQAGGQVIVSTSYEASGDIVMRVRDTGIGMSGPELEQAMKPFKQINALKRPRGDGTGLGLPLTKAMVEANRARFSIHSTPGEGTLVEIVFPSTRVLAH